MSADQITDIAMVPRLNVEGTIGATNQIQYCTDLSQANWVLLTNVVVTETNFWFVDVTAPPAPRRFYRVVPLPPQGMVYIPAGSFTMGNCMPEYEVDGELPLHTNTLSGFYIAQCEVTKMLWDEVYQWAITNGYDFDNPGSWSGRDLSKGTNHPVHTISWYDAVKWCNARSEKAGETPAYYTEAAQTNVYRSGQSNLRSDWVKWNAGYRLPTEAEWEKAARGGVAGHRFPWSDADTITHGRANYFADTNLFFYDLSLTQGYHPLFNDYIWPYTSPVGAFLPNGYGLYDMTGNVWEWCWDSYETSYYSWSPGTDPRGPDGPGDLRVVRGGSWAYTASYARCSRRYAVQPVSSAPYTGFRCVRGL